MRTRVLGLLLVLAPLSHAGEPPRFEKTLDFFGKLPGLVLSPLGSARKPIEVCVDGECHKLPFAEELIKPDFPFEETLALLEKLPEEERLKIFQQYVSELELLAQNEESPRLKQILAAIKQKRDALVRKRAFAKTSEAIKELRKRLPKFSGKTVFDGSLAMGGLALPTIAGPVGGVPPAVLGLGIAAAKEIERRRFEAALERQLHKTLAAFDPSLLAFINDKKNPTPILFTSPTDPKRPFEIEDDHGGFYEEDGIYINRVKIMEAYDRIKGQMEREKVPPKEIEARALEVLSWHVAPMVVAHEIRHGRNRREIKERYGFEFPLAVEEEEMIAFSAQAEAQKRARAVEPKFVSDYVTDYSYDGAFMERRYNQTGPVATRSWVEKGYPHLQPILLADAGEREKMRVEFYEAFSEEKTRLAAEIAKLKQAGGDRFEIARLERKLSKSEKAVHVLEQPPVEGGKNRWEQLHQFYYDKIFTMENRWLNREFNETADLLGTYKKGGQVHFYNAQILMFNLGQFYESIDPEGPSQFRNAPETKARDLKRLGDAARPILGDLSGRLREVRVEDTLTADKIVRILGETPQKHGLIPLYKAKIDESFALAHDRAKDALERLEFDQVHWSAFHLANARTLAESGGIDIEERQRRLVNEVTKAGWAIVKSKTESVRSAVLRRLDQFIDGEADQRDK